MKVINKQVIFLIFSMFLFASFTSILQVSDKISETINKGDAKALSEYFNSNVELVILDKEDIYSKAQAKLIMQSFFQKHPPTSFVVQHKGGPEDAKYCIGNYTSNNERFRIYFLIKTSDNKSLIHLFRIEEE